MPKKTTILLAALFFLLSPTTISAYTPSLLEDVAFGIGKLILGCPTDPDYSNSSFNQYYCQDEETTNIEPNRHSWTTGHFLTSNSTAAGSISNHIASLYQNPPAHTATYVADAIHHLNPAQPAYAQGVGFGSLHPILGIWKAFRDISYFLLVIIFVVVGFAIMFRAKLNPQTVISIQNALPKLIITTLLISFSYAIAGLLIDVMYLAIIFIVEFFNQYVFSDTAIAEEIAYKNNIITNMLSYAFHSTNSDAATTVGELVSEAIGGGKVIEFLVGTAASAIFFVVIAIAILAQVFRVFFALLTSYIQIVISVIFAPIQLLLNALPGQNTFNSWIKSLIGNLIPFPIVIFLLLLMKGLSSTNGVRSGIGFHGTEGFVPPQMIGTLDDIGGLITLAMILTIPELIKLAQKAIGYQDMGLGEQVRAGLSHGTKPITGSLRTGVQLGTSAGAGWAEHRILQGGLRHLDPRRTKEQDKDHGWNKSDELTAALRSFKNKIIEGR